jgi:hypothetical protein
MFLKEDIKKEFLFMEKVKSTMHIFLENIRKLSFGSNISDFSVG